MITSQQIRTQAPAIGIIGSSFRPALILIMLLFLAVYFGSAFSPGLQDDADSTHAEAAREMLTRGDFVTLHINGNRYLEKAPLMYWLVAGSYKIFGVNEFAVRVPAMLAMLGLVLLGIRWSRHAFGDRGGIYGGLFVATTVGYYLFTRILIPEAILGLFIALSFYWFLTALDKSQGWRWYAGYVGLALAVLTKGLLALVIVGMSVIIYLALTGDWRRWREFRLGTGLLLFFAIAAPWHLIAGFRNPRFFWFYFVNEHFLRFLGERIPKDYNKLPGYLYWTLHLVWLFPWSIFLPIAVRRMIRDYRAEKHPSRSQDARSFRDRSQTIWIIWGAVTLLFFAFSTNQEYYTFPAYFPIVMLIAGGIAQEEESGRGRWLTYTAAVLGVISIAASAMLIGGLWSSRHLPSVSDIGSLLAQPNPSEDTLSMGHMLDLTGKMFAALRLPAILATLALMIGPITAFWLRAKRKNFASTWTTAVTMAVFFIAAHIALVRFDPYLGSKTMAEEIAAEANPADRVMIYGDQAFGSSLLFYLKRPIELVNGRTTSMWFGSTYPDAPHIFLNDAELLQAWRSSGRVFLFVPEYERQRVDSLLTGPKYVVSEQSGKVVYSNSR